MRRTGRGIEDKTRNIMPKNLTEEQREKRNAWQREYAKNTKYEANKRSNAKNSRSYTVRVTINLDADIIERLDAQESVSGYLKQLVREDIKRNP